MTKRAVIITTSVLVTIVAILTILFGFVFRVKNISIAHSDDFKYKNQVDDILEISGLRKNDSIFSVNRNKVSGKIEQAYPYARVLGVNLGPSSVKISLTNRIALYYFVENDICYVLDEDCKVLEVLSLEDYNSLGQKHILLNNVFSAGESVKAGQFLDNKHTTTCNNLYKSMYTNAMLNIGEDSDLDGAPDERYLDREDMCNIIDNIKFTQEYELNGQVDKLVMTTSYGCKISIIEPQNKLDTKINMAFSALRALISDGGGKEMSGTIAIRYTYSNNIATPVAEYYAEQ